MVVFMCKTSYLFIKQSFKKLSTEGGKWQEVQAGKESKWVWVGPGN